MKLIDANTGGLIEVGKEWTNINGRKKCLAVYVGLFNAEITYLQLEGVKYPDDIVEGEAFDMIRIPLNPPVTRKITVPIRFSHPAYLFQRVAFFPS